MSVRDDVRATLEALCEGVGVTEDSDSDFAVELGDRPRWVRVHGDPVAVAVTIFGAVAEDVPPSEALGEFLNQFSRSYLCFRAFWEDGAIILRADLLAKPFVPAQFQAALEDFEHVAAEVTPEVRAWSNP